MVEGFNEQIGSEDDSTNNNQEHIDGNQEGVRLPEYYKDTEEWIENNLKYLHDLKIDYVFLTETSAISPGYMLKAAWNEAYPDEAAPSFYRIDAQGFFFQGKRLEI